MLNTEIIQVCKPERKNGSILVGFNLKVYNAINVSSHMFLITRLYNCNDF